MFSERCKFSGVNHAAYLIKAVVKNALPDSIVEAAQKFEIDTSTKEHVFRLIMQSQQWDSALEKLPQRRDKVLWWRRWEAYYGIPLARKKLAYFTFSTIRKTKFNFGGMRILGHVPFPVFIDQSDQKVCLPTGLTGYLHTYPPN